MKYKYLLLILLFLSPLKIGAQTLTFPAQSTNNTFTGTNTFQALTTVQDLTILGTCTGCFTNPLVMTATGNGSSAATFHAFSGSYTVPVVGIRDGSVVPFSNALLSLASDTTTNPMLSLSDNDATNNKIQIDLRNAASTNHTTFRMQNDERGLWLTTGGTGNNQVALGNDQLNVSTADTSGIVSFGTTSPATTTFEFSTGPGKVSMYRAKSTVAGGVSAEFAAVDATVQGAAITTTTLYAVPAADVNQYRLSWNAKVTTVDGVSSTLGALTITYIDPDGVTQVITAAAQKADGSIATTNAGNVTTSVLLGLPILINAKVSTNISYAMAYVSNTPGQMKYNLHIVLEGL